MEGEDDTPSEKEECDKENGEKTKNKEMKQNSDEKACLLGSGDNEANCIAIKARCEKPDLQQGSSGTMKDAKDGAGSKDKPARFHKRKYRSRISSTDGDDRAAGAEGSMAVDVTPKVDDEPGSEVEAMNDYSAIEAMDKRPPRRRKRPKRKSQELSSEMKKCRNASSLKKGHSVASQTNNDGPQTSNNAVQTNAENASDEDSDYYDVSSHSSLSSSSHNSDGEQEQELSPLTDDEIWLEKHTNKIGPPTWNAVQQLWKRECGCRNTIWQSRVQGSRAMVQKFELQFTLDMDDTHEGCVNALHFNQAGTLLASCSNDLRIDIWKWISFRTKPYISYYSGHRGNVLHTKFMPNSNDRTLISCATDGQVRVGYLSSAGTCRDTKKIAQHRGSAEKLALDTAGCPSTFLSCGEDSLVMYFDLRENKPMKKLVSVKSENRKMPLHSIDTSPKQPHEFAVSGLDQWARVYDRRMLDYNNPEIVRKYCPHHLQYLSDSARVSLTCLVYSYDGSELLTSYSDDDIYLFDTSHSTGSDFARKYKGHRNTAMVKGVNFYGPRSEFIVSGSDCGNIFFWDKASSKVVQFMQGDDGSIDAGVVNVIEPHPNLPMFASGGLDRDIKIWGPSGDETMDKEELKEFMLSNHRERHEERIEANEKFIQFLRNECKGANVTESYILSLLRNARMEDGGGDGDSDASSSNLSSNTEGEDDDASSRRGWTA